MLYVDRKCYRAWKFATRGLLFDCGDRAPTSRRKSARGETSSITQANAQFQVFFKQKSLGERLVVNGVAPCFRYLFALTGWDWLHVALAVSHPNPSRQA